jgi:hypothetical protein
MFWEARESVGFFVAERIFGHVPGYPEGTLFEDRAELRESGVHRPIQSGISGSQTEGAESIVLSGGYEDDADHGDVIIYTGQGEGIRSPASRSTTSRSPGGTGPSRSANRTASRFA